MVISLLDSEGLQAMELQLELLSDSYCLRGNIILKVYYGFLID